MSLADPAAALNGKQVGYICDRCNRGIRTGDAARFYATYYEERGWTLRRIYCSDCGESTVSPPTADADEVVGEAVFWDRQLTGVRFIDRSRPTEGGS
jgi:hypothetical protein